MYSPSPLFSVFGWMLAVILLCKDCSGKRNWDYEPLSIVTNSKNPDKLNVVSKVERLGRGEFALSGSFVTSLEFSENVMVEASAYRSSSGAEEDYKLLPWSIPKQTFKEFCESHYKEIIYPNVNECSNLPTPEGVYPLPKGTYKFDKCVVKGEGLPHVLPEGYYKIIFNFSGEAECEIVAIVKITTKDNMIG